MSYVKLNSIQAGASGAITLGRARLYTMYISTDSDEGYIRLRDGGSSGPVLFEILFSDIIDSPFAVELPRYGIPFNTSMYMEASNTRSVSLVFDGTKASVMELAGGGWLHFTDGGLFEFAA